MLLTYVYLASLLFSAVMAFICRKAMKSRGLTIFIPYLAYVFLQELGMILYYYIDPEMKTATLYNIYRPVTAVFYAWLFYHIPFNRSFRKPILILLSIYLAAFIVTFGFVQSIHSYNSYQYLGGGLMITTCAVFFLIDFFKLDNHTEEKKWLPVVWIAIGVVSFYPVVNISFALYQYIIAYDATIFNQPLYQVIPRFMSIIMYSCFARAFYLCKKKDWT